jgi:hypothetical protein
MKDSLLERARCRLRKTIAVPRSRETSTKEKGLTRYDQQAPDLAYELTATNIKPPNRFQRLLMIISAKHRRRVHGELTRRLDRDVRNARSIDISPTAVPAIPVLNPISKKGLSFLLIPPEIRNEVYRCLLPDVTNLRDVTGLLCACKRIRQELSSMLVAESQIVMNNVVQRSIDLYKSTHPTTEAVAFIGAPQIQTPSHLRNVNVSLGLYDTYSHPVDQNVRTIDFAVAFSYLEELMSLHLPYVTVDVPATIGSGASIGDPAIRRRLMQACIVTFRRLEETPGVNLNVQHVIFEIGKEKWDATDLLHPPRVVFVRRITKRSQIKYDLLWCDTRRSHSPYAEVETMNRVNEVVRKSRQTASCDI